MPDDLRNPLQWDGIDPNPNPESNEIFRHQAQQEFDLALAFKMTFESEHGKRVLAFLDKCTLEAATWMAGLEYQKAIAHGFAREGQNALVRNIHDRIELVTKAKDAEEYTRMKAQAVGQAL